MEPMKNKKIIIAGPCSISSKKELDNTFINIYDKVDFFRCGIWKARTNINHFQGIGEKGLVWLSMLKKKYKTPIAIEVGTPLHVEKALKHNINIFWIGARTTVNPFYVQLDASKQPHSKKPSVGTCGIQDTHS